MLATTDNVISIWRLEGSDICRSVRPGRRAQQTYGVDEDGPAIIVDAGQTHTFRPLFTRVADNHIEVRSNGGKSSMIMGVFIGADIIHPHIQAWTIEVPQLEVPGAHGSTESGSIAPGLGAAITGTPMLTNRSHPRIASRARFISTGLRRHTALTPYRPACVQRIRIQASQSLAAY